NTTPNLITPHGAIQQEINSATNEIISQISIPDATNKNHRTETRADSPTRAFTYTGVVTHPPDGGYCDQIADVPQFLKNYTDFQGHTLATIGYDAKWFINSVTDANNHVTTYLRGAGI